MARHEFSFSVVSALEGMMSKRIGWAWLCIACAMSGCIETIKAVRLEAEAPVPVPESLIPKAGGDAFGGVVQNCQSVSRSLSEFAGQIRSEQEKAGDWAKVFSIAGIAFGGGTAVISQ